MPENDKWAGSGLPSLEDEYITKKGTPGMTETSVAEEMAMIQRIRKADTKEYRSIEDMKGDKGLMGESKTGRGEEESKADEMR